MHSPDVSLAAIAVACPRVIPLFEELHLDYCCGGGKSLAVACQEQGLDVAEVLGRIKLCDSSEPASAPRVTNAKNLIDHIVSVHHAFTRTSIAMLRPLMAKVLLAHGGAHPELAEIARLVNALCDDLEPHLLKEEQVLFPALCVLENGGVPTWGMSVAHPIGRMTDEHVAVGTLLQDLNRRTRGYRAPDAACASWRALYRGCADLEHDLHQHIHLENNVLFPRFLP